MPTFDPEIGLSDDVIAFCPVSAKMTTGVIFGNHDWAVEWLLGKLTPTLMELCQCQTIPNPCDAWMGMEAGLKQCQPIPNPYDAWMGMESGLNYIFYLLRALDVRHAC